MLAIVIPYYKLTFFEETLQSLANQTDKRFKVYIGDDTSPENPQTLLEKFNGQFDFVYHRFESNLGSISLTQQWERCIALTDNEEWVNILGDDDVLGENVVQQFYSHLQSIKQHNCSVVRFATQIINRYGISTSKKFIHPRTETAIDFINRKFSKKTRSSLGEYLFKSADIKLKGFVDFPLAWHSDDNAVIEFSKSNIIYSINESCFFIRVSDESITGSSCNTNKKAMATQEFILRHVFRYRSEINPAVLSQLNRKLENAYFLSNKKEYRHKIIWYYISHFEFYALARFLYLSLKNKLYEGNKKK